jgi:hypothetical protein
MPATPATGVIPMSEPILRIQAALTDRDLVLLGWLADHGVLTTDQIAVALFPSVNFAQRRLRGLLSMRAVDRFRPQRPDGGSYPNHWMLAQLGTDVIASQRGEPAPRRDQARQRRWHLTNRANLPHLLGINDFFTQLAAHARTHPDAELRRWWSPARCQQAEPSRTTSASTACSTHRRWCTGRGCARTAMASSPPGTPPPRSSWSTTPAQSSPGVEALAGRRICEFPQLNG